MAGFDVKLSDGTTVHVDADSADAASAHVKDQLAKGWTPTKAPDSTADDVAAASVQPPSLRSMANDVYRATGGDRFDAQMAKVKKLKAEDEAKPGGATGYEGIVRAAKNAGNILADSATFGLADKAVAGVRSKLNNTPYEDELLRARRATAESMDTPGAGALSLAGGLGPAKALGAGYTALGLPKVGGYLGSFLAGGGMGAANEMGHTDSDSVLDYGLRGAVGFGEGGLEALGLHGLLSRLVPNSLLGSSAQRILTDRGITSPETQANIKKLGSQAMLSEGDERLKDLATGVNTAGGENAVALRTALKDRTAGARDRINQGVEDAVGTQLISPEDAKTAMRVARSAMGPDYDRIFAASGPVDVRNVVNIIDGKLNDATTGVELAKGPERATLLYARKMLTEMAAQPAMAPSAAIPGKLYTPIGGGPPVRQYSTPATPGQSAVPETLVSNPKAVQSIKRGINRKVDFDGPVPPSLPSGESVDQGALKLVGKELRTSLGRDVPGYDALSAKSNVLAQRAKDVDLGTDIFNPSVPVDTITRAKQPVGVKIGARGAIADKFGNTGTSAADLSALEGMVNKPYAQQKLEHVYGPEATASLSDLAARERTFAQNRQDIALGSQTGGRQAAREALDQLLPVGKIPEVGSIGELPGRVWNAMRRISEGTLTEGQRNLARAQIGKALSLRGQPLDDLIARVSADVRAKAGLDTGVQRAMPGLLSATRAPVLNSIGLGGLLGP